ncbi:kinase-like domain-containing protein [Naematelia encephala]|uniref:Kinase-like domain-containing protein n=1 Tax=Naematelia encephala TaxID=71784 RepID=A0A1Y2AKF9_9TREE|nr:kinase-like domain-containing protein [Naematelia encephala]
MGAACCKPEAIDFEGEVNLFHFYLLRSVGKGAFGKVRVVQHKHTKTLFALKYINKAKCVKMKAVANIVQERRLLEEIDHPFVVNLRYAFQDDENCFFVLDLMLGGDLRFHLDRAGAMNEETVRFYMAEIASAVDYLHSKRIVHRDLKPDNILLDERGHAHITDFNIAVHFSERRLLTGVAGSMAYMAPEVLTKRGYSAPVDFWSLGILGYELLFGKRPFRGRTNTALTNSILNEPLSWPEDAASKVSTEGMRAIQSFLERDPNRRLGYRPGGGGMADIKAHPWFRGLDWGALHRKEIVPPFEPDSKRANFDATHELEELLLEENPLKARKRKEGQDVEAMTPEMRMMEEHFKVFDYTRAQRRSYYHPAPGTGTSAQTTSATTAISSNTAVSTSPTSKTIEAPETRMPSRPTTPSDRTGVISRTGMDVEAQILDGGGMANLGGRGGWKSSDIEMSPSPLRQPTPLRPA